MLIKFCQLLSIFCILNLYNFFPLIIFTRKLVGYCNALMSTCSAICGFFRCFELLEIWVFEEEI